MKRQKNLRQKRESLMMDQENEDQTSVSCVTNGPHNKVNKINRITRKKSDKQANIQPEEAKPLFQVNREQPYHQQN
jgi:hypothetical protein